MKEMKKMGRTLGTSSFSRMLSETESARVFILRSGAEARFISSRILHDDIESQTFINEEVNGRDQTTLTPESVSDISRTIALQQFFPAIGREVNGRIEILDGSRRRAACLYNGVSFDVLVTRDNLSLADARQLAIDIQTAKEHTLRELGRRLQLMYPSEMSRAEIAQAEGLSAAKVTRAFQAASVPEEMIALFPSISDLSISDYQQLLDIADKTTARHLSLTDLVRNVRALIEENDLSVADDLTARNKILGYFRTESQSALKPKTSNKVVTEKIANFPDKKQFVRKKIDSEKRMITYEFSRIPAAWQDDIDSAVKSVLDRLQDESKQS